MKQIERWLWRYKWAGRKVTGAVHMSEEEVMREHPDAVRVEGSKRIVEEPETEEEHRAARARTDTSRLGGR
jgi:hypothetical protein